MAAIMPPARDAEKGHTPSLSSDPPSATATTPAYDPDSAGGIDEKKLVRKIDLHVLPYICVMYLLAFLDRCALLHHILASRSLPGHSTA